MIEFSVAIHDEIVDVFKIRRLIHDVGRGQSKKKSCLANSSTSEESLPLIFIIPNEKIIANKNNTWLTTLLFATLLGGSRDSSCSRPATTAGLFPDLPYNLVVPNDYGICRNKKKYEKKMLMGSVMVDGRFIQNFLRDGVL